MDCIPQRMSPTKPKHANSKEKTKETPWITTRTELLTMATQTFPAALASDRGADAAFDQAPPVPRPSRLRRIFDFIVAAQMRRAERHLALYGAAWPTPPAPPDERSRNQQ
jgi:hypothetical protein